jgi:copper oxidase (laccase) domain-containing protein
MIFENQGKSYLNLAIPLKAQLAEVGILDENIELPLTCTYCQNDEFFSYRKDSQETYGEILGVISLKNKDG